MLSIKLRLRPVPTNSVREISSTLVQRYYNPCLSNNNPLKLNKTHPLKLDAHLLGIKINASSRLET